MNESTGYPPPAPAPPTGFFASVRRIGLWRTDDRWIGGVAAGVAHRMNIDPLIVRGLFVVTTIFGGFGLLLYGLGWALLPEGSDGRIHLEEAVRGHFDVALAGAIAFVVLGTSNPVFWWSGVGGWGFYWLVAVAVIIGIVLLVRGRPGDPAPGTHPGPPGAHPGYGTHPYAPGYPHPASGRPAAASTAAGAADASPSSVPGPTPSETTMPLTSQAGSTGTATDDPTTEPLGTGGEAGGYPTDGSGPGSPGGDDTDVHDLGLGGAQSTATGYGATEYGGGHGGGGYGGWDDRPPMPAGAPPPPPVRVIPGPGSRLISAVLALCLLATAGLALADHAGVLDANVWLLAGGAVLTLLGLGVVLSGILGRRQGALGLLGFLTALVMVPITVIALALPGFARVSTDGWRVVGEQAFTPTTTAAAAQGAAIGAGALTVDLTGLDPADDVTVPVDVGFGVAHLIVPDGAGITVDTDLGAGEVSGRLADEWTVDFGDSTIRGTSTNRSTVSSGVGIQLTASRPGTPHITIETDVGFGQIVIEEQP